MDAKWIWLDPTTHPDMQRTFCTMLAPKEVRAGAPYGVTEFCRTVALREAPVRVRLRVSGDTVFRLWLNGRFVGEGPVCAGGDWLTFSALPQLITGFRMEEPGFARVSFAPRLLGLQHAEVTFPTPRGEICCRLVQGEPPQLTVPAGISYTVRDEF